MSVKRLYRAYTLIEMLIVVTILGIAAAIVVPAMGDAGVLRVQSAVRQVISDINYVQSEAIAHQESKAILFYPSENRYVLLDMPGGTVDASRYAFQNTRFTTSGMGDARITSTAFTNSFGNANLLIFDEQGSPVLSAGSGTAPSNGTVQISGSGQTFTITVEGYTGRVSVSRVASGG
jgi:prepilin-type N-terminal cleavage/methylation domain-containing protein